MDLFILFLYNFKFFEGALIPWNFETSKHTPIHKKSKKKINDIAIALPVLWKIYER